MVDVRELAASPAILTLRSNPKTTQDTMGYFQSKLKSPAIVSICLSLRTTKL